MASQTDHEYHTIAATVPPGTHDPREHERRLMLRT